MNLYAAGTVATFKSDVDVQLRPRIVLRQLVGAVNPHVVQIRGQRLQDVVGQASVHVVFVAAGEFDGGAGWRVECGAGGTRQCIQRPCFLACFKASRNDVNLQPLGLMYM